MGLGEPDYLIEDSDFDAAVSLLEAKLRAVEPTVRKDKKQPSRLLLMLKILGLKNGIRVKLAEVIRNM